MKLFEKISAAVLAACMTAVGMLSAMPVSAAPVVDPEATGSLTIHKFAVEDVDDYTVPANGLELENDPDGATPIANITFRLTQVQDTDTDVDTATETGESVTATTNSDGIAIFDKLPVGVYKVVEVNNSAVRTPVAPFLVSIPMTNPVGDGWLYDIHVYPKNELVDGPEIDKFVRDADNELSKSETFNSFDEVTWVINADIPADIANAQQYIITDQLDSVLAYVQNSLQVVMYNNDGTSVTVPASNYELTVSAGGLITIDFENGFEFLAEAYASDGKDAPYLQIEFNTTFTDEIYVRLGANIYNGADLEYTNSTETTYNSEVEDEPEVHTGGLNIIKVDASDNSILLEDARFKIYTSLADAQAGTNAIQTTDEEPADWEVSTDTDGAAAFNGLAYGTYWIVETQAPQDENGKYYNLLAEPQEVVVSSTSHMEDNEIVVENKKGFTLPQTGGMGTILFSLIGALLIGSAGIMFAVSKKKNKS